MSKDSGARARAADSTARFHKRREITSQVRVRFARYGDEVLSIVLACALQPKRLPILLRELRLKPPNEIVAQLDAISSFIAESGAPQFLSRARKKASQRAIQPAELEEIDDPAALGTEPERAPRADSEFSGPERRSGKERRIRNDRRAEIEAISKNKRYGGDRRKRRSGRRKTGR